MLESTHSKRFWLPFESSTPPANEVEMLGPQQYVFVQAVKNMMAAALEEPRNQRFLLLSESCAPLYPPAVVYQQARPHWGFHVP